MDFQAMLQRILDAQIELGAADMWVSSGSAIMVRVGNKVRPIAEFKPELGGAIGAEMANGLVRALWQMGEVGEQTRDFAVSHGDSRFRINASRTWRGPMFTSRLLPPLPEDFSKFNIPERILEASEIEKGIFFVTGPTGSGKTTTLAAILSEINRKLPKHVLTLEDPIEFRFNSDRAFFSQKEVGRDVESFAAGLKSALRESPDVILVGEVRDYETARLAAEAAATGHFVLTTLHTIGVYETLFRFVSMFPGDEQKFILDMLKDIVRGIVSQTLIPRDDEEGKVVAVFEYLFFGITERAIIQQGELKNLKSQMEMKERRREAKKDAAMLETQLIELIKQGIISKEKALNYVADIDAFKNKAKSEGVRL